jgi:hypothetical protein
MSDPVVRHRLVVEALDRQIERVCEIDTFVDSGSNNLDDVLTIGMVPADGRGCPCEAAPASGPGVVGASGPDVTPGGAS